VEVVEQPFRRRRNELTAVDVVGEDAVGVAEYAGVVVETGEERARLAAGVTGERESGSERPGAFFQAFDAEELGAEWLRRFRAAAAAEEAEQFSHLIEG
jgi:hypothetical protein